MSAVCVRLRNGKSILDSALADGVFETCCTTVSLHSNLLLFVAASLRLGFARPPKALEEHLGTRVNLRLSVKLDKNWRRKKTSLKEYGYMS